MLDKIEIEASQILKLQLKEKWDEETYAEIRLKAKRRLSHW